MATREPNVYRGYQWSEGKLYLSKGHFLYGKPIETFKFLTAYESIESYARSPLTPGSREEMYELRFQEKTSVDILKRVIDEIIVQIEKSVITSQ